MDKIKTSTSILNLHRIVDLKDLGITCIHTSDNLAFLFNTPRQVLSSAVLNGGLRTAGAVLNMQVQANPGKGYGSAPDSAQPAVCTSPAELPSPQESLAHKAAELGLPRDTVGMMTAASMISARLSVKYWENEYIAVAVTTGLSNARRAGDPADFDNLKSPSGGPGTINIIMMTSCKLAPETLAEALMILTEAKCAALQDLQVKSKIHAVNEDPPLATGTGTDALVVASGEGLAVPFWGKHTKAGELTALAAIEALKESLKWYE